MKKIASFLIISSFVLCFVASCSTDKENFSLVTVYRNSQFDSISADPLITDMQYYYSFLEDYLGVLPPLFDDNEQLDSV